MNRKHILLGGFMMMKMKLLAVVLILVAAGAATAAEVINVDIKGYGDNTPYVGNGAYNVGPNTVWTVFYGGYGVPVGSSRSEGLATADQSGFCSVYAAQVWLGDNGLIHGYQWGDGSSLMNDGFTAQGPNEPNLAIFGQGAFQGVYDIYVYGSVASGVGTFRLTQYGVVTSQTISGDANAGEFKLGENYVVFSNVDINNSSPEDLYLTYKNVTLNALQFVKKKSPVEVKDGTIIGAGNWDVAGERNMRNDDPQPFGPDTFGVADPNIGSVVGNLDVGEFMGYDINVGDANQGRYYISLDINTSGQYRAVPLRIYLDDKVVGDVCDMNVNPPEGKTTDVSVNLFKGSHTIKWHLPFQQALGGSTGFNVIYLKFTRTGSIAMNNCSEVVFYGVNYPADLSGNCTVALEDFALAVENWLICNNPDPDGCF
jgi:hypothetical protein